MAPAHSAERSSAPRLPGSVTPSTATRNGGGPPGAGHGQVVEQRLGERRRLGQHALRRLAARLREELGPAHLAHRHPLGLGQLDDVLEDGRGVDVGQQPDLAHLAAGRRAAARARPGGPRPGRRRAIPGPPCRREHRARRAASRPAGTRPGVGDGGWAGAGPSPCPSPCPPWAARCRRLVGRPSALLHERDREAGDPLAPGRARPRPSARLPFTVTGAPTAALRPASISSRRGASFGASSTTVQSTLAGAQPAAAHVGHGQAQQLHAVRARRARDRCRGSARRCRRDRRRRAGRR